MAETSAQLRRLGTELRRLREATGRTQTDVGEALGRTKTTILNWERGKTKLSKSDLVCLLVELRAPVELRKGLEKLRQEAPRRAPQWATYGLPDWMRPLVSFEQDAVAIQTFEPVLIPGLLQTEEYAHAIHTAGRHKVAPEFIEKWVAARMQRQQRLRGPAPATLHAVIAEAALHLEMGGRAAFARQLECLLDAASSDNITLQILAAGETGYGGVASNFHVLHFAEVDAYPPLGCFDGPLGGYIVSDEGDVATMVKMFDDLSQLALSEADSAELLAANLKKHRRKATTHA
ncbi:helix-turn-helix domain-containing protein [Streptomyces milbemycinicus]|uniref:Helix-turn-helix transcriptional regulator n=1 Tax=Streptomyces milbemycinicus TaxID=476552 RepID=A0ABW8LHL5_9ACTN